MPACKYYTSTSFKLSTHFYTVTTKNMLGISVYVDPGKEFVDHSQHLVISGLVGYILQCLRTACYTPGIKGNQHSST